MSLERAKTAIVLALRYVFLTRFSWMSGVLLLGAAPVCLAVAPKLLANLFVLDQPHQLVHVSWISLWAAATVMETMRVTTLNADARFDDYFDAAERFHQAWGSSPGDPSRDWYRRSDGWLTFVFGFVAALSVWYVVVDACVASTSRDPTSAWTDTPGAVTQGAIAERAWTFAYRGLAIAVTSWLALTALAIVLHEVSNRRWRRGQHPPLTRLYRILHLLLGPGYFREDEHGERLRLAPGHFSVLCYTVAFLVWYAFNYALATGSQPMPTEESAYPALFYFLLSLLLMIYLLPGVAFFLDRYRVPTALTPVLVMMLFYNWFDTDHYYQLNPSPARNDVYEAPRVTNVLDKWRLPLDRDGKRTLIVVDASGGGIQASAWTAQVLTGLHEQYGDSLTRSIGMISSVSGGSVGAMFYVANRSEARPLDEPSEASLDEASIERIRFLARSSAMEASAWGLAYADSMRAAFPPAVKSEIDRGWAIERVWRQRIAQHVAPTMSDWRITDLGRASMERQLPIVVFNATLVETGQRLLISPVLGPPSQQQQSGRGAVEWMQEFPRAHPYVATAARLSATFPYVAPAARSDAEAHGEAPAPASPIAPYHVVDGAYVDNEGAVTSVDWISKMLTHYQQEGKLDERPFDRILLIRIQAFPQTGDVEAPMPLPGWRAALAGPLDAMLKVRRASQTERGDLEIGLLTQATRAQMRTMQQRYEADIQGLEGQVAALEKTQRLREQLLDAGAAPEGQTIADVVRQQLEADDHIQQNETLIDEMRQKANRLDQLTVEAITIDFQSPSPAAIPLSWKLTPSQKASIDVAWESITHDEHPQKPLLAIDRYFQRVEP